MKLTKLSAITTLLFTTTFAIANCGSANTYTIQDNKLTITNANKQVTSQSDFNSAGTTIAHAIAMADDVQNLVKAGNTKRLAKLIHYPLAVNGKKRFLVKTPQQFIKDYPTIFTTNTQAVILKSCPLDLMASFRGVMMSNGMIWFEAVPHSNRLEIFTVNPM